MRLSDMEEDWLVKGVVKRRCFAWIIDGILVGSLVALAWHLCLVFGILTLGLGFPLFGALPAIPLLYTWVFTASSMGATPGMALMGLVLARNDDLGQPSALATLGWTIAYYVTMAAGVIWLFVALITTRKRTIHDLLSGLVVVRTKALTDLWVAGIMPNGGPRSA